MSTRRWTSSYARRVDHEENSYRYSFITPLLPASVENRIRDDLGATVTVHGHLNVVTVIGAAYRRAVAGMNLAEALAERGVAAERTQPDLVNRRMIAERARCTRQAVALWVTRQRHQHDPFPLPVTLIPGETWAWAEVNSWLARNGYPHETECTIPGLEDYARLDSHLLTHRDEYREIAAAARRNRA